MSLAQATFQDEAMLAAEPLVTRPAARVAIRCETDVVRIRTELRSIVAGLGFSSNEQLILRAAVSELARNILDHAGSGEIALSVAEDGSALRVVARDEGPGIANERGARRGVGLAAVRRLMDELVVETSAGGGTTVAGAKWLAGRSAPARSAA